MTGLGYLAAAYSAIWIAIFFYLLSIGRRARRLEKELDAIERAPGRER